MVTTPLYRHVYNLSKSNGAHPFLLGEYVLVIFSDPISVFTKTPIGRPSLSVKADVTQPNANCTATHTVVHGLTMSSFVMLLEAD